MIDSNLLDETCKLCNEDELDFKDYIGEIDDVLSWAPQDHIYRIIESEDSNENVSLLRESIVFDSLNAQREHGLFLFDCTLNGAKMPNTLLDCGASRVYLDLSVARDNGFALEELKSPHGVKLANGKRLESRYYIPRAKLKFTQFNHVEDIYILDLNGEHGLILGQTFLVRRNPDIDWQKRTMTLRKKHGAHSQERSIKGTCFCKCPKCGTTCQCTRCGTSRKAVDSAASVKQVAYDFPLVGESEEKMRHFLEFADEYEDSFITAKQWQKQFKKDRRKKAKDQPEYYMVMLTFEHGKLTSMTDASGEIKDKDKLSAELKARHDEVFTGINPKGVPPVRFPGAELKLDIDLKGQSPPSRKAIRLSESQLAELRVQIEFYLERGWIRPSNSPYATPVFFQPKPHTAPVKWRMCCDYRAINKLARRDAYPLPAVDVLVDRLRGAKVFSKLDLTQYFHQIPIHPDSIAATAITTRYGNFEWLVIPFGLANAPAIAQRMANVIFREFIDDFLIIFMDDILIFSESVEEHQVHLDKLFERMKEYKIYAHPGKCEFFTAKVEFLGLGIYSEGVFITEASKQAIKAWEIPRPFAQVKKANRKINPDGKTSLRTFLGMAGFFRKFIPKFAQRTRAISDLLPVDQKFQWGEEQQKCFDDIKEALLTAPVLQIPDSRKSFVIMPDASKVGIGSVLLQDQGSGLKPCAYLSQRLNATQRKLGTYENELWAMIKSFQTWKHYLHGTKIQVQTDHAPLKWFQSQAKVTDKVGRWLDFLSEFDFDVVHVPREKNAAADALSKAPAFYEEIASLREMQDMRGKDFLLMLRERLQLKAMTTRAEDSQDYHMSESDQRSQRQVPMNAYWMKRLKASYKHDPFCKRVLRNLDSYTHYKYINGILYRSDDHHGLRIYVPERCTVKRSLTDETMVWLRSQLLVEYHDVLIAGHQGVKRSLKQLQRSFWWPTALREMRAHIRGCPTCQRIKARHHKQYGKHVGNVPTLRRWEIVSFDFITDLPKTSGGNDAIHVAMDQTSRRVRLDAVNMTITSRETAKLVLGTVVRDHGVPAVIISDRDVRYTAAIWQEVWRKLGTHLAMSASYQPLANAPNERSHQVIEDMLRAFVDSLTDWDLLIPMVEFAINNHVNVDTGFTPFEIDCGQHPLDPMTVYLSEVNNTLLDEWAENVSKARRYYIVAQERRLAKLNSRRIDAPFSDGDRVMLNTEHIKWHEAVMAGKKLKPRFIGPYVIEAMSQNRLSARLTWTNPEMKIHPVQPVSRLEPYHEDPSELRTYINAPPASELIEGEEYFVVEKVTGRRYHRGNKRYSYRIKYEGYPDEDSQWLPEWRLKDSCQELLRQYDLRHPREE